METMNCSFCGKHENSGMTHSTCIIPNVHYYFCHSCWNQWNGWEVMTNVNLLKLKMRVKEGKDEKFN